MKQPPVILLRQFYASLLGRWVRAVVSKTIAQHWPELNGDNLLALGYATPFMRQYMRDEDTTEELAIIPAMPAEQSAIYWPSHRYNRVSLVDVEALPYPNAVFNRIVMVHVFEHAAKERALLDECWRLLTPGGRMLVVVPHRRSVWSRSQATPFSDGKPYSISQLKEALCDDLFTHVETSTALLAWPTQKRSMLKVMDVLNSLCSCILPTMGGVIVMEVEKQIYASVAERATSKRTPVYAPVAKPAMTRI